MTLYAFKGVLWDAENSYWLARLGKVEYTDDELKKLLGYDHEPEQRAEVEKALAAIPQRAPTDAEVKRGRRLMRYAEDGA